MTSFHIVVALSAVISVLAVAVYASLTDIKRYKKENAALRDGIRDAVARLENLREYMDKRKRTEEESDAERQELDNTADAGLASRANALFSGVRDRQGGGNGGT
jgi:type II secretory pathway component PulJ